MAETLARMSTLFADEGTIHIEPDGMITSDAVDDHWRRRRALVPVAAATRRFNHSRRERREPAPVEVSVCVMDTCSHLEPTPNEPGKHR